jgi:hypothetical protein
MGSDVRNDDERDRLRLAATPGCSPRDPKIWLQTGSPFIADLIKTDQIECRLKGARWISVCDGGEWTGPLPARNTSLTEGLKGFAGDSVRRALQAMVRGRLSAIVFSALFTVLIQSSTATTLTVIGFVSAGLVTFAQAVGVIIGATFGTTSTPWLVAIFGFRLQKSADCLRDD